MFVLQHERDSFDKDGVLRPGLQARQQNSRVRVLVGPQLHIHHIPAVGAAAILSLELSDVLIWPGRKRGQCQILVTGHKAFG